MPIADFTTARNTIVSHFRTAWLAQTPPIPELQYDDVRADLPDGDESWARIFVRHGSSSQVTIGKATQRRFRRIGLITIQVFTPAGGGLSLNDIYAKVAMDAFEGTSTGGDAIEFRDVSSQEVGVDGPWFQTNVTATFVYDETK